MDLNRKTLTKLFGLFAALIVLYLVLQHIDILYSFFLWVLGALTPFIIAGFLTFILNVPLKAIEHKLFQPKNGKQVSKFKQKARRPIALTLSIILFVVVLAAFLTIIIPEIGRSLTKIADSIPMVVTTIQEQLTSWSKENEMIANIIDAVNIDWNTISKSMVSFLQSNGTNVVNSAWGFVSNIISAAISTFLGIVISIYTLMRKEKLSSDIKKVLYSFLPMKISDNICYVAHLTNLSFYNSITGQMVECIILGSLTALGMSLLGLPYAALIAVLIAILSWIPMFGVGIGIFIGAILILTIDPLQALWFVIFMVILQQLEGNLIYPRVVGSNMGLPPLIMVGAITLFANFFGVIGLLVAAPVTSVVYTLLKAFVADRIKKKKIAPEKYAAITVDEVEEETKVLRREKRANIIDKVNIKKHINKSHDEDGSAVGSEKKQNSKKSGTPKK